MNFTGKIPSWTEVAQYRYDSTYKDGTVVDAVIVGDDLSDILVMERRDNIEIGPDTYDVLIYSINLENGALGFNSPDYDISDCLQLNNSCTNRDKIIPKRLQFNLADWQDKNQLQELNSTSVVSYASVIPIDAFTIVPTENQGICNENETLLVATSDNDEAFDTYILYFCYNNSTSFRNNHSSINSEDAYWYYISNDIIYDDICPYIEEFENSTQSLELDITLMCIIAVFIVGICTFHIYALCTGNHLFRVSSVRRFAIYSLDFLSDAFFVVQVQLYIDFVHFGEKAGYNEIIFLLSALFVILPTVASVVQLQRAIETWSNDPYMSTIVDPWYVNVTSVSELSEKQ